ncbi:hypothetical protein HDC36_003395 [Xanthomonas sp. JAI131]|uniref:hypothetical protein n=1 Tax=Xanthomonas sp. JAI131 TaxID=2723067 RepID=UPI0015C752A2|nr:hypothetical protein [Xanthomonas sp. JAI131]NYF21919.1 hypothetical protein [Xanthomonas sp. JAI131]
MANLLSDPTKWESFHSGFNADDNYYEGPPSAYWDAATSSYYYYAEMWSRAKVAMRLVGVVQEGDTVEGEFEELTRSPVSEVQTTLTAYGFDGTTVLWTVEGYLAQRIPFAYPAVAGMVLATANPASEEFLYTGESRIYVAQPPEPVAPGPVYVVPHHLRAYSGYDTPLAVWVRDEAGHADLSQDVVTVVVSTYQGGRQLYRCDAAASAAGEVTWIHPASIARQHRPGVYRVKVVSSLRGVIGDGLLEVV